MILRIFKSQHPLILALSLIILILLWLGTIIDNNQLENINFYGQSILFEKLYNNIRPFPVLYYLIPMFSIICQFFIILKINVKFILFDNRTYLPAILFVLLSSSLTFLQGIYPVYFASPIVLLSIYIYFSIFKVDKPFSAIFLSTFILAISSMFFHFTIYLIVFMCISLFVIRTPNFREILILILGIIVPYLILISYLFVFDDINDFSNSLSIIYKTIPEYPSLHYSHYIFLAIITVLFILTVLFSFNGINIKKIDSRKFFKSLMIFLFVSVILFLVFPTPAFFILISLPLAFLISIFLITWKNKLMLEILFTILLLSIIYIRVSNLLGI